MSSQRDVLKNIRTFPQLIKFLRDELDWPIESDDFEELTFDYTPEELGIDAGSAAKIQDIKRLRPLSAGQPWGIFFVKFEPKRLPVVALRRVLSRVVLKKRASANRDDRAAWQADDLLFISNYGEGTERQISFAHFSQDGEKADLPTLKVLGWDNRDTPLHLDDVADTLHQKLTWPAEDKNAKRWREQWRSAFTLRHLEVITTSKELAVRLADLARAIRDRIRTVMAIETEKGPLTRLMKAFQQALIHDLSPDDFADMYAQTIAYGLLSARVSNPSHDTADAVATHIPVTNPFLKELMETFLHLGGRKHRTRGGDGIDFDELGVSEIVELLDVANMQAVVRDFGDRNRDEDPVIHFYELFLKEYDAKKRLERGVFYTPQPVVSYIVRSVHELLQAAFALEDGLASTVTWGAMAAKHGTLKIPDGVNPADPFVVILDPATGTATFLVEVIEVIHDTLSVKWKQQRLTDTQQRAAWNEYVPKHLLPRLHGYELLMAPYAIAHMKIGLKLYETGYRFGSDERARIYLTNALEPATDDKQQREFEEWVPALAHEAKAVNAIKRLQHFTIVIGNPPYSGNSANQGRWISDLLHSPLPDCSNGYFEVDGGPLGERNPKWLNDDYVKFIRYGQLCISRSDYGILGFITNHGYIDNPTFRGMRQSLLTTLREICVLDLHGNVKKKETAPDGALDENVFDIQQGVAVLLGIRGPKITKGLNQSDIFGPRAQKYSILTNNTANTLAWKKVSPVSPFYVFLPQDDAIAAEYLIYPSIKEVMPVNVLGFQTHRDDFAIAFDRQSIVSRCEALRDHDLKDAEIKTKYALTDNRDWNVRDARKEIRDDLKWKSHIIRCLYRPFDVRWCYFSTVAMDYPRRELLDHVAEKQNLCLLVPRQISFLPWQHAGVSDTVAESCLVSTKTKEQNYNFPLYVYPQTGSLGFDSGRRINFSHSFLKQLAIALDRPQQGSDQTPKSLSPEDIFHCIYALFYSPSYRKRYADFLKMDFPRVPLTRDVELFRRLAQLGSKLAALHLVESPMLDRIITTYAGTANASVEKISYADETVWLDRAQTRGFKGVPEDVWNFHIGGYQVCEKWLKDRKGRALSKDDVAHYQKIIVALAETIRLMLDIDEAIKKHGGWPGAFKGVDNGGRENEPRATAQI